MGRRAHIERTVPSWLEHGAQKILVVDYSCPDKVGEWVRSLADERAATLLVPGQKNFHKARALNEGISASPLSIGRRYDWLLFLDADTRVISRAFFETELVPGTMTIVNPKEHVDLTGVLLVETEAVERIQGFDEKMTGWGGEDLDMRVRLYNGGLGVRTFGPHLLSPIEHGDRLRVKHHVEKDRNRSNSRNLARMRLRTSADPKDPVVRMLLGR